MSGAINRPDSIQRMNFTLTNNKNEIESLSINGIEVIAKGIFKNISLNKNYKKELEASLKELNIYSREVTDSSTGKKSFWIERNSDGDLEVKRSFLLVGFLPVGTEEVYIAGAKRHHLQAIEDICQKMLRRQKFDTSGILKIGNAQKITEISKPRPEVNKVKTAVMLGFFVLGFIAFFITLGVFAYNIPNIFHSLHIPMSKNISSFFKGYGIPDMPNWGLALSSSVGIGALIVYTVLKHKAKKNGKLRNELNEIKYQENRWFIPSNLNDLFYGMLLMCFAFAPLHIPLLMRCLAFPAGALFLKSGAMQLSDSRNAWKNVKQDKRVEGVRETFKAFFKAIAKTFATKEGSKAGINTLYSLGVIAIGIMTLSGQINGFWPVGITSVTCGIALIIPLWCLAIAIKKYLSLGKVNEDNEEEIYEYLEKQLSLTDEELGELYNKVYAQEFNVDEKREKILNELIHATLNQKRADFGSILNNETFIEAMKIIEGEHTKDILKTFKEIKKQTRNKLAIEFVKTTILYGPMFVFPLLKITGAIPAKRYDIAMAVLMGSNLALNLNPSLRNVPPAGIELLVEDINKAIKEAKKPAEGGSDGAGGLVTNVGERIDAGVRRLVGAGVGSDAGAA